MSNQLITFIFFASISIIFIQGYSIPRAAVDELDGEYGTAAFANLDRQLRSEELVPLSRRMREILNYASRVDESALDSDSGIRVPSKGEQNVEEKEPLAVIFLEPIPDAETTTSTSTSSSDSESSSSDEAANLRVKKSFGYYPARG